MIKEKAMEVALSNLYFHTKEDFEHEGFIFKQNEYYFCEQDQYYVTLVDDNNIDHLFTYKESEKLLSYR